MNAKQLEAMKALSSKTQGRVNSAQMQKLQSNSPTADDILNNDGFFDELNHEINHTIDAKGLEKMAPEAPADQGTVAGMQPSAPQPMTPEQEANFDNQLDELERQIQAAARVEAAQRQAAAEQASEEPVEPEMTREEMMRAQMLELLASTPGAPSLEQIEGLKKQYGQNGVQLLALGEGDVYIYTYLRRSQWKRIQELVAAAANTEAFADKAEEMLREKVIQSCVLWPKQVSSVEFLYNSRAGVMDTLYQVIMLSSYFLEPSQALQLTISL